MQDKAIVTMADQSYTICRSLPCLLTLNDPDFKVTPIFDAR